MRIGAWAGIGLLSCGLSYLAWAQNPPARPLSSEANKPWPASVAADLPKVQPVLTPEQALKTFTMPPGYRLELVAAEPLVKDPILAEYDGDGRLWVLELHGFAVDRTMNNSFEPINELVVLDDTDGDGVFDTRTVFLDKLVMPRAFKVLAGGCALVGEPPNLWKACDTDGDLKADTKDLISDKFATRGVVEHGANGLLWSMDNSIVIAQNDWDLSLKGGKATILPGMNRGQWGVTQDDQGRVYRVFNTDPLYVDYLKPAYYARNPNMVRTRGLYEVLADPARSRIWPARPTFGVNRGYRTENYREDGSQRYYGGVSSPMIYRGTALPGELWGQPFVVDGPTNLVHLLRFAPDAAGNLATVDYYEKGEFLASTDERFRPISLAPGWDGTFYVVDMYRGVSQDGPLQTDYLRAYILERDLWQGVGYGRIYRVVHEGMKADARPRMSSQKPAELVAYLAHPNGWWRDMAQQILVQRGDISVAPALARLVRSAPDPRTRLQALWTLDGLGAAEAKLVDTALKDADPAIRAAAIRLSEPRLGMGDVKVRIAVAALADDPVLAVRRQAAASLGELPLIARALALLAVLQRHGDDPVVVDAVVSGLAGHERMMLGSLLDLSEPARSSDAVEMLAGAIGRSRDAQGVQAVLDKAMANDAVPGFRLALLSGLGTGLQGAARPGPPVPGAPVQGRLQLAAAPADLIALAAGSDAPAQKARQLTAQLDWPGKPQAPVAPARTAEQQRLFNAGKEIFANTCEGCHTAAGRGSEIAANLDGSKYVTGRPDMLARILLAGKEGTIGLMPPAGAAMSDEEVAAIMTFVRGSWSNRAGPVAPDQAKEWRAAYAYRQTPWTEKELGQ